MDNISEFLTDKNFYLILNSLDEGVHIVNQDGETIFYNQKVAEIDGLNKKEVMGKSIFEVYPSLTLETSTLMRTLKYGELISDKQQSFINCKEEKITTINRTFPIQFENGEKGAMEISRDITQLKELVESVNCLRKNLINKNQNSENKNSKANVNISPTTTYTFNDIVGENNKLKRVIQDAMKASGSDSAVLIMGETGTGKELFAQSIHAASRRGDKPFIAQNCAALPKNLLEGLLFGTEKGAFTGAKKRPGLFEQADGGTILLDEINSMDLNLQSKLLRVLQENKVRRVGGRQEKDVDVRVISTINIPPDRALQENKLREDLFYRLSVVYLNILPLRERKDDITVLTDYFVDLYNEKFSRSVKGITEKVEEAFKVYKWPGNVRELQHVIESAFNMLQNEKEITVDELPGYIRERLKDSTVSVNKFKEVLDGDSIPSLNQVLEEVELHLVTKALEKSEGNVSAAARELNISRQLLQYKMKKYEVKK